MATSPNGQASQATSSSCSQCGSSTDGANEPRSARPYRSFARTVWMLGLIGVLAVALLVTLPVWVRQHTERQSDQSTSVQTAIREWWIDSRADFIAFRTALNDSQEALQQADVEKLNVACERVHDVAAVDLSTRVPTPDARLTAELTAAVVDAHDAAHICMSTIGGALISYRAEFDTDMAQANKHLDAAREIVDRFVSDTRYA